MSTTYDHNSLLDAGIWREAKITCHKNLSYLAQEYGVKQTEHVIELIP